MRELLRRLAYLRHRRRMESEMAEEMAFHREQMEPGKKPFGSDLRFREDAREIWGWAWLDRLRQDLTYGARILRNSPGFTLTAMLVLALGIGVPLTALRAALDDLRGGSLPDPDTLVHLVRRAPGALSTRLPYPAYAFYRTNASSFRSVMAVSDGNRAVFGLPSADGTSEAITLAFATPNYFPEFGIVAAQGRLLNPGDDQPGTEPAALISQSFWQNRLASDPSILGRGIRVNGTLLRVVGVLSRAAKITSDVWLPLSREPDVIAGSTLFTDWNSPLDAYARLKPGVSPKTAAAETLALAARLREIYPAQIWPNEYLEARPVLQLDTDGQEFRILLTAAALVLMLLMAACANLGTLVLARGVSREREIRTRLALGASRPRIVRQLFTESLLLAALSGICGLVLSSIALKMIQVRHNPDIGVLPDWRSLAATFGIALLAALVFGLPPALRLTSIVPRAGRTRTIFLAAQVAASCLLLIVSSLLLTGVERLEDADQGFNYRSLVWITPDLKAHGYSGPAAQSWLDSLLDRTRRMQGVQSASETWLAPWGNVHMGNNWIGHQFAGNHVDSRFLETMGIRLLRGRNFRPGEKGVALVSQAAEKILWPGGDSLGKYIPWEAHGPMVIGVVRNASTASVGNLSPLEFYLPQSPGDAPDSGLLVRVSGKPEDSIRPLQNMARSLDVRLQPRANTLADSFNQEMQKLTRALAVIAMLGGVAILLSAIGLAGLAGYTVAQRTCEIGIRIALGARAAQIVRIVIAPMCRPVFAGYLLGLTGGVAVAGILRSGIPALASLTLLDPLAWLMALAFFAAVAGLAILLPGLRAIRLNPAKTLQHE